MILFWFVIAIAAILGIARYNEDDRLFWKLMLSFVFAFTVTTVTYKVLETKDKKNLIEQVYPTQAPTYTPSIYHSGDSVLPKVTSMALTKSDPVSKDTTPATNETFVIFDKIREHTRDQPPKYNNRHSITKLIHPPIPIDSS